MIESASFMSAALAGEFFTVRATWKPIEVCVCVCVCVSCSVVSDSVALGTVACQAPGSMEFSRHEYWNGLPFPPSGDFPKPGIEPAPLKSSALADMFFTTSANWEAL